MISSVNTSRNEPYFNPERSRLLTQVFKKTLIETAITGVFFTATVLFVASSGGIALLAISAVTMILFNAGVRITIAELIYRETVDPDVSGNRKAGIAFLNEVAPFTFALSTLNFTNVLVHEAGHAVVANAFFETHPQITIYPFQAGVTYFPHQELTRLGHRIGEDSAHLLTSAAGPFAAFLVSTALFTGSYAIAKSHPELSKYLFASAVLSIAQQAFYALTALWTPASNIAHDFVNLSMHGISPFLCLAGIVAVPILVKIGFAAFMHFTKPSEQNFKAI